jgi:hypothetical protein
MLPDKLFACRALVVATAIKKVWLSVFTVLLAELRLLWRVKLYAINVWRVDIKKIKEKVLAWIAFQENTNRYKNK